MNLIISVNYFQASFKALTGANYAYDANKIRNKNELQTLAKSFDNQTLLTSTKALDSLLHGRDRMQYPTVYSTNTVPHDVYTSAVTYSAEELSRTIVEWCRSYIERSWTLSLITACTSNLVFTIMFYL